MVSLGTSVDIELMQTPLTDEIDAVCGVDYFSIFQPEINYRKFLGLVTLKYRGFQIKLIHNAAQSILNFDLIS